MAITQTPYARTAQQGIAAPPKTIYQGIGGTTKKTGLATLQDLEKYKGSPLTADERTYGMNYINYTDMTGAAGIGADQYNKLMEHAASMWGGTYQPWQEPAPAPNAAGQQPYPQTGPVYPQAAPNPTIPPVPEFQAQPFAAPTWDSVQNDPGYQARLAAGASAIRAGAGAAGMDRTSRTMRGLTQFGQELASDEYQKAYSRAADTHGINAQERQAAYAPRLLDWQTRTDANQRNTELDFDRSWQRELYGRDDAYRRWRAETDDTRYNRDDAWRRYVLEEERRRFLASNGQQAAATP